mmetsp:Transcript_2728/g.3673  ORF Transcript_2728/g.3673 Transcript_2728/m.3673 type:complete len:451 (-) Transcript_2728:713-2065(-)
MICMKTRTAIEGLQNANIELKKKYDSLLVKNEEATTQAAESLQKLADSKAKLEKARLLESELESTKENAKKLNTENELLKTANKEARDEILLNAEASTKLKENILELKKLKEKNLSLSDTLKTNELKYKKSLQAYEESKLEMEKKLKLTVAVTEERLAQESHKTCSSLENETTELKHELCSLKQMKINIEAECERYKLRSEFYCKESKSAREELCKVSTDLKNSKEHEEMELRKQAEKFEAEKNNLLESHDQTLRDIQKATIDNLNAVRTDKDEAERKFKIMKQEHKEEIIALETKLLKVTDELESIRKKWFSSIANKRNQNISKASNASKSRSPRERIVDRKGRMGRTASRKLTTAIDDSDLYQSPKSTSSASRIQLKHPPGSVSSYESLRSSKSDNLEERRLKSLGISKNREAMNILTNKSEEGKKKRRTDRSVQVASRFMKPVTKYR